VKFGTITSWAQQVACLPEFKETWKGKLRNALEEMKGNILSLPKRKADFIEPMDCAPVTKLADGPGWLFEIKLDVYRAIGVRTSGEAILYSRNCKNFNKRYPRIAEALKGLPCDTVVDGEVVALDDSGRPNFHRLQHFTAEASHIPRVRSTAVWSDRAHSRPKRSNTK
jgi:ATP-dependent DNA ligase